jgi:hypothetical protein
MKQLFQKTPKQLSFAFMQTHDRYISLSKEEHKELIQALATLIVSQTSSKTPKIVTGDF